MFEQRSTFAALVAACMVTAFAAGSFAQQAAPPAVLVQAAEQTPIAANWEFVGRAAAVDKVELRARVKGFLGPRKFADGDMVKMDEVVFTIEPETYQATVDQKVAQRDCRAGRARQRRSPAPARHRAAADQHRHQADLRPAAFRTAAGQGEPRGRQGSASRCRDPALLHRHQVADRRTHRPRRGVARQPRVARLRRAGHGGERNPDPRAVPRHPARAARCQTRCQRRRSADRAPAPGRRQPLQGKGQARLHRHHGRSQDRRPDRAGDLRQQGQSPDRRPDRPRDPRGEQAADRGDGAAAGHRRRSDRALSLRRRRQERGAASARQDRHRAQRPAGHQRRPEGGREGHHPGPAARARRA